MPSFPLPNLLVDGDGGIQNWAVTSFTGIDEPISNPDTAFIQAVDDTNGNQTHYTLSGIPADFGSMETLSINIRYRLSATPNASRPDSYGISAMLVNGTAPLAGATPTGAIQTIVPLSTTTPTSFTNIGYAAFTFINTSANKATWEAMDLILEQDYAKDGGFDNMAIQIDTVQLTGSYLTAAVGAARRRLSMVT